MKNQAATAAIFFNITLSKNYNRAHKSPATLLSDYFSDHELIMIAPLKLEFSYCSKPFLIDSHLFKLQCYFLKQNLVKKMFDI